MTMENKESRRSAIKWHEHYMGIEPDHLIGEYRSILESENEDTFPSIEMAMEKRAPTVKEGLNERFD